MTSVLVLVLFGTSCVRPACFSSVYGFSSRPREHFATIRVFAEPVEGLLKRRYEAGVGMWERFERSSSISIDGNGRMTVADMGSWPDSCPKAAEERLAEVAQAWQPILEPLDRADTGVQVMANPFTYEDDWRPDGPLIEIFYGSPLTKTFGLMWDGRLDLPTSLDTAVIGTLELACSSSRLAEKVLRRDLPPEVASRLDCSASDANERRSS